jgi:glycosyltransferase involved in cell wall biosynthesis
VSPGLLSEIKNDAYEKVIFFCYLYHPTLAGLPSVAQKAVLVPLAHDEWPFYMECVKRMVSAAPILVCNTDAERDFIFNHIPKQPHQIVETGALGIPDPVESGFQENGIREHIQQAISEPYFLYLGRISAGKGVQILLDSFASYKGACRLVMAGHLEDSIVLPKSDKVIYLGFVDENEKNVLLKNCLAVVNPSQYESLSIIALEGMLWQKPLLLNLNCLVFERYAKHVKTVLGFRSKEELTALLNSYSDSSLPQAELVEARQWVLKKFSWPAVLRNFEKF